MERNLNRFKLYFIKLKYGSIQKNRKVEFLFNFNSKICSLFNPKPALEKSGFIYLKYGLFFNKKRLEIC